MRLRELAVEGFRNLRTEVLAFEKPLVVVYGENGQGKTNLLEAIWYGCTLKPLRGRRTRELVGWGQKVASVRCSVVASHILRDLKVRVRKDERRLFVDGKACHDLNAYLSGTFLVSFGPAETRLITGEPANRRGWLDRAAFNAMPVHLSQVKQLRRCLAQKSAALHQDDPSPGVLDALDAQLAQVGAAVVDRRARILASLMTEVEEAHTTIAGLGAGTLGARFRTVAEGESLEDRELSLIEALQRARESELRRGHVLTGPQKDEVVFTLAGRSARTYASRGQVRSIVLALKLAEMFAAQRRGVTPLFLLDDLGSELDLGRTGRLLSALVSVNAQVVVTTTARENVVGWPADQVEAFRIHDGAVFRR